MIAWSADYGRSLHELAHAWLLAQPGMTAPIIGTTRMQHLEDAVAALDISLTDEDRAELEAPYRAHPVLGID